MHWVDWLQLLLVLTIITLLAKPLGLYLCKVLDPTAATFLDRPLKWLEKGIYHLCGIDPRKEHDWKQYLSCTLWFSFASVLASAGIFLLQRILPWNPQGFGSLSWDLNLNTAISFMTNTDWQSYGGETTMSYFSQMGALAVQNFASAAVGLSAAAALVRGLARKETESIGNFWADVVRVSLYVLLPISMISALFFMSQGVPQNLSAYVSAHTVEGGQQLIAQGPIASQEAIKILGSNGGGFMNANSAHPFENPTPLTNFVQVILILLIPSAQIYYFGKTIQNIRHARCIFAALGVLFVAGVWICAGSEFTGNPDWSSLGILGANWEGKEQRFGIFNSALYACTTTAVSCGSVNCMHDSFTPIGGLIPMLNIQLSEVIFGGVGAGLYSVLIFVLIAIFIAGLIIGKTPEYLGKKIEVLEIKMIVLAILPYVFIVHLFTCLGCSSEWGTSALGNQGPHGFSEILYAFSSCGANNGSAFAGISTNTPIYNVTLALAMLCGRFCCLAPVLVLAGSLAKKKIHPKTAGSFPVSSLIFITLLVCIILLIGALTFIPALTMGPILEQFELLRGVLYP